MLLLLLHQHFFRWDSTPVGSVLSHRFAEEPAVQAKDILLQTRELSHFPPRRFASSLCPTPQSPMRTLGRQPFRGSASFRSVRFVCTVVAVVVVVDVLVGGVRHCCVLWGVFQQEKKRSLLCLVELCRNRCSSSLFDSMDWSVRTALLAETDNKGVNLNPAG